MKHFKEKFAFALVELTRLFLTQVFACFKLLAKGDATNGDSDESHGFSKAVFEELGITLEGNITKMELKEGQTVKVSVGNFKTKRGHDASIETASGEWVSSDDAIASVEENADNELEATVTGVDGSNNASVVIEFRADGDPAGGTKAVVISGAVTVTQGDVATGDLTFGTPEDEA